jgi:hypothetical protein
VSLQPQPARFALCSRRAGNRSARALSEPFVLYAAGPEFISSDPNARFFSKRASRCPNLFARSLQSASPGGLSVPARHVSRGPCQGVKESRLIEQARLWRPHARLPPALLFGGRKDPRSSSQAVDSRSGVNHRACNRLTTAGGVNTTPPLT